MSKNKLSWSIALFLIAITSLPIAYAQAFTGTRIFFVLVNAAVIGLVLFILQAILVPQKGLKEKGVVWFVVVAASLVLAFLFGQNGFIWQTGPLSSFFNIYVFVNALIIGVLAYFILAFFEIGKKLISPQGNTGYLILIFLGSMIWAAGIYQSYGPMFIWEAYKNIVDFLIGTDGILNPNPPNYRLAVLAGSYFLLSFFFNQFLAKGGIGGSPKVTSGLALVIAINMAAAGAGPKTVIIMAEAVFIMMLATALEQTVKGDKWWVLARWIIAFIIVGWASAAATYKTEYQGFAAWVMGTLVGIFTGEVGGGAILRGLWGVKLLRLLIYIIVIIILLPIVRKIVANIRRGTGGGAAAPPGGGGP